MFLGMLRSLLALIHTTLSRRKMIVWRKYQYHVGPHPSGWSGIRTDSLRWLFLAFVFCAVQA